MSKLAHLVLTAALTTFSLGCGEGFAPPPVWAGDDCTTQFANHIDAERINYQGGTTDVTVVAGPSPLCPYKQNSLNSREIFQEETILCSILTSNAGMTTVTTQSYKKYIYWNGVTAIMKNGAWWSVSSSYPAPGKNAEAIPSCAKNKPFPEAPFKMNDCTVTAKNYCLDPKLG